ncbi:glycoside hydrolase family 25 protein [Chthonobacter rhizosphaerae]|uniref:glycoside hydrolase family 25 protein n=1 Tax=Chthonobacter rhizosphaerae TaxID=2735553 RepID=UPI0015EEAF40|nr:GH25 family lysozyme [Chthonobacter rhizosphaerae]
MTVAAEHSTRHPAPAAEPTLRRPVAGGEGGRSAAPRLRRAVRVALSAAVGLALSACALLDFEPPGPEEFPVHGIDVSYYQEEIDWMAVRNAGTTFAWIKATEGGDWLDPKFAQNYMAAGAAGLARGAYHFYYFCRPVEDQIAWFIRNVPVDPTALPPVLDMEWNSESKTCRYRPPRAEVHANMRKWLTAIEAHYGKRPVIYSTVDFYRDRLAGAFGDYHIWLRSVAGHPSVRYGDRKWHFWQHTATGRIPGIRGNVDRNVFFGSPRQWQTFLMGAHDPRA